MEIDLEISDEEYVIERAKSAFKTNPAAAKAWMITAKTLYPNNFGVQVNTIVKKFIAKKITLFCSSKPIL